MFGSLWMMLGFSSWWRRLTRGFGAVANWVGASPFHVVLTALLAALMANGWQWHERDAIAARDARNLATWQRAFATEQGAFHGEQQAAASLRAALASQNASVEALSRTGASRTQSARAAFLAAVARDTGYASLAHRIEHDAATPDTHPGCRTPEVVMNARDVL